MKLKTFKPKHADILVDNFLLYCSARSGGGKSHLVTWLCSLPKIRSRFSCAVVVSPTSNLGVYKQFEFIPAAFHHKPDKLSDVLNGIKQTQSSLRDQGHDPRCLLILDDCLTDSRSIGQTSRDLAKFVSTRRHYGVSMILISQRIQACSPSIRNQCSCFISFVPRTLDDRAFIIKNFLTREYVNHSRKETMAHANEIMDTAFASSPYAALCIDCVSKSPKMLDNTYVVVAPEKLATFAMNFKQPRKQNKTVEGKEKQQTDVESNEFFLDLQTG